MKQFTYKFFCLLGFLLIGGGNLTAQTLTQVTSLEEITESDYYILYYNGYSSYSSFNQKKAYMYEDGTQLLIDASTTAPSSIAADAPITFSDTYKFQFLKVPDTTDQFYIKSFSGKFIKGTTNGAASLSDTKADETNLNIVKGDNGFAIRYKCDATYYSNLCGYFLNSYGYFSFRRHTSYQTVDGWQIYKLAGATKEQVDVTIKYYLGTNNTPIYSTTDKYDKSDKSLSDLVSVPSYVTATYYLVDSETETEVADINAKISENATYKIVTSYNENFTFPQTSNEYFALKMGTYYLGTYFGITAPNNENKYSIATTIDGDWYNGFSIIGYNGKKLYYDGTYINWSETEDYKWKISNNMKFTIQDGTKYLAVYSTNCLASADYAAELASSDAATAILKTVTPVEPEYVGQLPYDTSDLTFDEVVKGIDLTNGTYYFIEKATDANTVLSSDATTTFGNAAASANFTTNTNKGFNELWQYQNGYFVHANSGLKLTASALDASGTVWNKTATSTAQAYKLNNGTADFTSDDGNDTWKFRLAKSVTISLTPKDGTSYATTCAPVVLTLPENDDATTLYIEKSHTESSLSVESATAVAANTGIYIENTSGATSATLLFAESGTTPSAEAPILHGTNVTLDISSDDHSLYRTLGFNSDSKIGFFKPSSKIVAIPANRAFLHFTSAPTSAFYIDFDGTTTGIDTLLPAAAAELDKNAPVYDLSGRRIQGTLRTGIYLQNGRKFMVK